MDKTTQLSMTSPHIIDVTQDNAQQVLIEQSHQQLVMIDFWAAWCAPCKSLYPILEKLVDEYNGRFILAKVDCDQQAAISSQFGVRSMPTIVLMKDGQPVDGFTGLQAESFIRDMLDKHLPKTWEALIDSAQAYINDENFLDALPLLKQAYDESDKEAAIACLYAETLVAANRLEAAQQILEAVPMVDHDVRYQQIIALLELKHAASQSPELLALEEKYAQDENNLSVGLELAIQYSEHHKASQAFPILIHILRTDKNFENGKAKETLLNMFKALGNQDPLVAEYQRQLFSLLY